MSLAGEELIDGEPGSYPALLLTVDAEKLASNRGIRQSAQPARTHHTLAIELQPDPV
jgi:hypothetical protein